MLNTIKLCRLVQKQCSIPVYGRWPLKILALELASLTEVLCSSAQSYQANDGMEPSLDHDKLLPNPFQLITH